MAFALFVSTGCATRPPDGAPSCDARERTFLDQQKAGELKGAAQTFVLIIHHCPASLGGPLRSGAWPFIQSLASDNTLDDRRYEIEQALFASGWRADLDSVTDNLWLLLTQEHLKRKNLSAAGRVARTIAEPATLLQMRVDKRFDALVNANRSHFDIANAIDSKITRLRDEAAAKPHAFQPWMEYAHALQVSGRYQEALEMADEAIAGGSNTFDDFVTQYPWMLTTKGFALMGLGRTNEGVQALEAAERYAIGTHAYVNFAINLGVEQERAGHPDAALATFEMVRRTSDLGALILQVGIAKAALQKGDLTRADEALAKARENCWKDVSLYMGVLLRAGRMDEARDLLLQLLRDLNWRGQALFEVQNYRKEEPVPAEKEELARFSKLVNLPEVQRAILEVGRIETFDFLKPYP
jgi:tetratricopeptide (TPR) repeat protein